MIPILAKKNPFINREKYEHLKEENTKNTLNYIELCSIDKKRKH